MKNEPGYPLPSGELGEDDIVCQLVYLPDRPEYWQAFLGALHYMTTWRAWERDADKRGKDAAANWREAFELTIGCWRMTCLEQLQDDVAAILAIMEMPQSCCDETDVTDGDRYTDRVVDGVGNVPQNIIDAGYATGTSDWAGFDDYKCMIAHVTVDQLDARLRELAPLVNTYGAVFGGLASLAAIISVIFSGGGTALVFGLFAATGAVALLYEVLIEGDLLEVLADKVDTNHDDLACAIYRADGDVDALADLNTEIDAIFTAPEALILKNMNLGPTIKSLYAGRYDQQDIAEILEAAGYEVGDFTCDCDQIGEFLLYTDFETGTLEGWQDRGAAVVAGIGVGSSYGVSLALMAGDDLHTSVSNLAEMVGETKGAGDKILIHRILMWYRNTGVRCENGWIAWDSDAGSDGQLYAYSATFVLAEKTFSPPIECTHNLTDIIIMRGLNGDGDGAVLDNITVDFDIDFA